MTHNDRIIVDVTYNDDGVIKTVNLSDGRIYRLGLCEYSGKYGRYIPVPPLTLSKFLVTATKKEIIPHAKRLHHPQKLINRLGSDLWSGWGLRRGWSEHWFVLEDSGE
jgi:hypothetical protein